MRSVLVTRPQPAGDELADKLRREGFSVWLAPMTEYVEIPADVPDFNRYQAIIFTSAQGVTLFAQKFHERLPIIFAVGDATAQAASKAGFSRVYSAAGDGKDVVDLIKSKKADLRLERLLHICGEDTAQDMGEQLAGSGLVVTRVPIYKARLMEKLPADVGQALAEGDITTVTLFSARTAANFARLMQNDELRGVSRDLEAVCLSDRVAAEITGLSWKSVVVANTPQMESVIDLLRKKDDGRAANAPLPADPVIEAFGGLRPLANRLDITASTVQGWKKRGVIPDTRVAAVIAAAREANIDLDHLWAKGNNDMSDDDKTDDGKSSQGGATPPAGSKPKDAQYRERRRLDDRRQKRAVIDRTGTVRGEGYTGPDRRTGLDRRSYEERQQARIRGEQWRFFNRSLLMGAVFTGAILYAGAFLMAPEFFQANKEAEKLQKMEAQMTDLQKKYLEMQKKQEEAQSSSLGNILSHQIGGLEDKAAAVSSTVTVIKDVAAAAAQKTETGRAVSEIFKVLGNINQLNKTPEGRKTVQSAMSVLKMILGGAYSGDTASLIEAARKQDPALAKVLGDIDAKDVGAAAMLLALNEFRSNVQTHQTFDQDLAVLQKLAGNDKQLQMALQQLAPYAKQGVLSREELQTQFRDLASDIVMAKLKGQDLSVKEEMLRRLSKLIKARRVDDIQGNTVDAVVARAQLMLNKGDVHGAMRELNTLEGQPAAVAEPWMQQAAGNVIVDDTMIRITQAILQQVQESTGFSLDSLIQGLSPTMKGGGYNPVPVLSPGLQGGGGGPLFGGGAGGGGGGDMGGGE
ncbi:MAG: uroporphyrinogen-III synthase [Alphaproteobacteria bacterium]